MRRRSWTVRSSPPRTRWRGAAAVAATAASESVCGRVCVWESVRVRESACGLVVAREEPGLILVEEGQTGVEEPTCPGLPHGVQQIRQRTCGAFLRNVRDVEAFHHVFPQHFLRVRGVAAHVVAKRPVLKLMTCELDLRELSVHELGEGVQCLGLRACFNGVQERAPALQRSCPKDVLERIQ